MPVKAAPIAENRKGIFVFGIVVYATTKSTQIKRKGAKKFTAMFVKLLPDFPLHL